MILNKNIQIFQIRKLSLLSPRNARLEYEIPERYRNSFYLANAAFFDSTNWFLHNAYEVVFSTLKNNYRTTFQNQDVGDVKIHEKLENIVESLDQCNSIIDVRFPLFRENGKFEIVRGFRAHYGETVGHNPCLGGLRIGENITRDHMKALSMLSAMKHLCLGIGLSGAHGGIKINPKAYSENELRQIIDSYVNELYQKGYCGPGDIVHPDISTSIREMRWITESFAKCSGQNLTTTTVGKPVENGGIEEYYKAAAMGAMKALEMFLKNSNVMLSIGTIHLGFKDKKFIIQGLGKVGRPLALMMIEKGAVCVGVREQEAYLYDAKGLDLDALLKHRDEKGTLEGFGLSKTEYPDSIYTEACDILVLAACHKSLACYVARDVKAKVILEAADGPVTPAAHKILTTKSKLVIPDIYACAGTNVVSYFEYLKNLQEMGVSEKKVLSYSNEIYVKIFDSMIQTNQARVVEATQTENIEHIFTPLDKNFAKNAIDCVLSEVGMEIFKNMTKYQLNTDAKTAAYAVAIKNLFTTIFKEKKLV